MKPRSAKGQLQAEEKHVDILKLCDGESVFIPRVLPVRICFAICNALDKPTESPGRHPKAAGVHQPRQAPLSFLDGKALIFLAQGGFKVVAFKTWTATVFFGPLAMLAWNSEHQIVMKHKSVEQCSTWPAFWGPMIKSSSWKFADVIMLNFKECLGISAAAGGWLFVSEGVAQMVLSASPGGHVFAASLSPRKSARHWPQRGEKTRFLLRLVPPGWVWKCQVHARRKDTLLHLCLHLKQRQQKDPVPSQAELRCLLPVLLSPLLWVAGSGGTWTKWAWKLCQKIIRSHIVILCDYFDYFPDYFQVVLQRDLTAYYQFVCIWMYLHVFACKPQTACIVSQHSVFDAS